MKLRLLTRPIWNWISSYLRIQWEQLNITLLNEWVVFSCRDFIFNLSMKQWDSDNWSLYSLIYCRAHEHKSSVDWCYGWISLNMEVNCKAHDVMGVYRYNDKSIASPRLKYREQPFSLLYKDHYIYILHDSLQSVTQGLGDFWAQPAKIRPSQLLPVFFQNLTGCKLVVINLDRSTSCIFFLKCRLISSSL